MTSRATRFLLRTRSALSRRFYTTRIASPMYTATAVATGGRDGKASLTGDANPLDLSLAVPKSMGGDNKGHNPEQLFALGYSACFTSALAAVGRIHKVQLPTDFATTAAVHIGRPEGAKDGFSLAVDLTVNAPGMDKQALDDLVVKAHDLCPYSSATRNNIVVTIKTKN